MMGLSIHKTGQTVQAGLGLDWCMLHWWTAWQAQ